MADENLPERTDQVKDLTIYQQEERIFPYHRDPAYRPWLIAATPRRPTPYEEILAIMAKNVSRAVIASRCSLAFALLIVLDFAIPKTAHHLEVTGYKKSVGGSYQMILSDRSNINISKKMMKKMKSKSLTIYRTKFFNVPWLAVDKENNRASFEVSVYGNFIFMPITLLLTALVGTLYRKGVEFRFNLGVASAVLALFNIVFFNIHKI